MKITINKKTENFTIIDNTGIRDERLSWKAKGLLTYLLHLPNDWQVYLSDLKNRSKDGRDSTASAIKELEENGYIRREKKREKGKFANYEYTIYEIPLTASENPNTVKPKSVNPPLLSTNNTKLLNKVSTSKKRSNSIFKPPNIEEIKEYVKEKELTNIDPKYFLDYFTEGNWIDSKGNKVKNWKQKILTWAKYNQQGQNPVKTRDTLYPKFEV